MLFRSFAKLIEIVHYCVPQYGIDGEMKKRISLCKYFSDISVLDINVFQDNRRILGN